MQFLRKLLGNNNKILKSDFNLILLILLALIPTFSAFVYYFYALNNFGLFLSFFLSLVFGLFIFKKVKKERAEEDGGKKILVKTINNSDTKNDNKTKTEFIKKGSEQEIESRFSKQKLLQLFYLMTFFGFLFLSFRELFISKLDKALISPWELINPRFFIFYGLSTFFLIILINKNKILAKFNLIFLSAFYFLSFSVAIITYLIAYGFDPFIHQATIEYISKNGLIEPKTPYYIGQYGLILILNKIGFIFNTFFGFLFDFLSNFLFKSFSTSLNLLSIEFLNKILVPFISACLLPKIFYDFLKDYLFSEKRLNNSDGNSDNNNNNDKAEVLINDKSNSRLNKPASILSILALLIIGFSPFILTTPQNLSYVFLILTIFLALKEKTLLLSLIFALASATIHPLSGIPAFGFILFALYGLRKESLNKLFEKSGLIIVWFVNIFTLPFALYLGSGRNLSLASFYNFKNSFSDFFSLFLNFESAGRANLFLNINYFINYNKAFIILIIIIISLIYFYKVLYKIISPRKLKVYKSLIYLSITSLFSYFLSALISFNEVISYEQSDYAKRILTIIIILNLPFILLLFKGLIIKILNKNTFTKLAWAIFLTIIISSSLYNSYPRIDKYYNSRGYSTGINDLKAVLSIEEKYLSSSDDLNNTDLNNPRYIVLANQQVSAGALKIFGFDRYLKVGTEGINEKEIYFYPIPTGGELYNYYLEAVYNKPDKATIKKAIAFASVDEAYLVINKYWNRSAELINEAKLEADEFWQIENEVFIFRYLR